MRSNSKKSKINEQISFAAVDYVQHPDKVQIDGHNIFALKYYSKHAELYAAYKSILYSLEYCEHGASYILAHNEKDDGRSVTNNKIAHATTLIIHYGRCFASGRVKLEQRSVPAELLETHNLLLRLRNNYVAHSGGDGEVTENLIGLYPNRKRMKIVFIAPPFVGRVLYINAPFLEKAIKLIHHLKIETQIKLDVHYKMIRKEIESIDIEKLYEKFGSSDLENSEYSPQIKLGKYDLSFAMTSDGRLTLRVKSSD